MMGVKISQPVSRASNLPPHLDGQPTRNPSVPAPFPSLWSPAGGTAEFGASDTSQRRITRRFARLVMLISLHVSLHAGSWLESFWCTWWLEMRLRSWTIDE
jgi:hypothetical protein